MVEYCNGPVESPMAARRAAPATPPPTTCGAGRSATSFGAAGNAAGRPPPATWTATSASRRAMLAADPAIRLYAWGAPCPVWAAVEPDADPRRRPLADGHHRSSADRRRCAVADRPTGRFRDFMAVPDVLDGKRRRLRGDMEAAGIPQPRLAVTELQMFAHLGPAEGDQPARMTRENLVTPATQAEALYDALIYHRAVRWRRWSS